MRTITVLGLTLILAGSQMALADSYSTDFEDFIVGYTDPQVNGTPIIDDPSPIYDWRGDGITGLGGQGDYDAEIVDLNGNKVFRISNPNSAATGNYDTTHPATPALDKIGETGSGGQLGSFCFSFDFMAASDSLQDGLRVDVTPFESGTASRHGIFRITDDSTSGFSVGWWETNASGSFNFLSLGSQLARDEWHTVSVKMDFANGADNDTVTVNLNGLETLTTTWEGYYRNAGGVQPLLAAVDSLIFRIATGGGPDGGGVYFDNLSLQSKAVVPEPATMSLLGLGVGGLVLTRIRRKRS